jgi:hypothetical protein|tara:strand:- start:375 stop:1058 length:684 start_codon:yes stop_codon:yes gene_type:complete
MIVSIHQPNYLPWLGFFDKIKRSNSFVIFDNVQYPRSKGHFGNRNKIKINNGSKWLTVPVEGKSEMKNFNQISYKDNGWKKEHLRLIEQFYRKSQYYKMYIEDFKDEFMRDYDNLSDFNTNLINFFLYEFDIETTVYKSSKLVKDNISGAERIMTILKKLKATKYITGSGPGSKRYINEDDFKKEGIELEWQDYKHKEYKQLNGEFIPYMSALDLLFNKGPYSNQYL